MERFGPRMMRTIGRGRRHACRPRLEAVEARILLANFVVMSTSDTPVAGYLTLRQAITEANATPGPNTISFNLQAVNIPGIVDFDPDFQDWHFQVNSPLPAISNEVSIDGYTQRVTTGSVAANESQFFTYAGANGGTFTLNLNGETTAPIPFNATGDQISAALEALPSIGANNVETSVTSIATSYGGSQSSEAFDIEFVHDLGLRNVGTITIDPTGLEGEDGLAPSVGGLPPTVANTGDITSDQNAFTVGFNGQVRIIIDGYVPVPGSPTMAVMPSTFPGLTIDSSHNLIRGLAIDGFSTGVVIAPNVVGNQIQGDEIGKYLEYPNPTFINMTPVPTGTGNRGAGVLISGVTGDTTTNNVIGGVSPETHDAIAGNGEQGVVIDPGAGGNEVTGDLIGVLEQDPTLYFQQGNGAEGVLVESPSNEIGGAVTGATNVISDNETYGIHIVGATSVKNQVEGNYIGTDINGEFVFGQGNPGNGQDSLETTGNMRDGIFLDDAPDNIIGIPGTTGGNVISGNFGAGVRIAGASATGNVLEGNTIGADLSGKTALPNREEGVVITSADNIIGGLDSGDGNQISGNLRGVTIDGSSATGNLVAGNTIGLDITGTYELGNAQEGIRIDGASGNTVGGLGDAAKNVISGNNLGVLLNGPTATKNLVFGNLIGTSSSGLLGLGNSLAGVSIQGGLDNTIGGSASGAGNVIGANDTGILIEQSTATGNVVQGNLIGVGADGLTPLGNEVDGVLVDDSAAQNSIGGLGSGDGNIVADNVRDGVRISSGASVGNAILSNSIYGNGGLGIDLVPDGTAPGPNRLIGAPVLSSVASTANGVLVAGSYQGAPDTSYVIQLFATVKAGAGQGEKFLGTTGVTTGSNGTGTFSATFTVVVSPGEFVTGTATDSSDDTSEFSAPIVESIGALEFSMTNYTVDEAAGIATITVQRVGGSGGYASLTYMVSNGTAKLGEPGIPGYSYSAPPNAKVDPDPMPTYYTDTLVFDAGINTETFNIPLLDDGYPGQTLTVNLSILSTSGAATIGSPSTAILDIQNSNLPGAFSFSQPNYTVNEAQGSITIAVTRDTPGIPVTVNYATSGGSAVPGIRYQPVSGTLVFASGQTVATFSIPINDDTILEGDQTVGLVLSDPTNGSVLGIPSNATLTIQDDLRDRTPPTVDNVQFVTNRNHGITALQVSFDQPLNASTATNLLNYGYSVRTAGLDHKFGTRDDVLVPINSAGYNPVNQTVTLYLGRVIHPPTPFRLAINQSTSVSGVGVGVSDLAGNLLAGDGVKAGTPFTAVLSEKTGPLKLAKTAHKTTVKAAKVTTPKAHQAATHRS